MALEQQREISITSTVLQFEYNKFHLNLLDTPGHHDFSEDTYRTLTAADNAVMLVDAAKGLETQTRKLFEVCRLRDILIFTFARTGKKVRLTRPQKVFARERESMDEAFPGDVIGLNNPGAFAIGDTIYTGKKLVYQGIFRERKVERCPFEETYLMMPENIGKLLKSQND